MVLAKSWAHRVSYFDDIYGAMGKSRYRYSPEDLEGYDEEPAFVAICEAATGQAARRCDQIRSIAPATPVA